FSAFTTAGEDRRRHLRTVCSSLDASSWCAKLRQTVIQFWILGPFEVREDGQALDIGSRKQRALLAVLLLRAGEAVSVDELIDALGGARPPDRAVSSVHAYVSRLRRVLGRDRIVRSGDGYRLQVDSDELDVRSFEEGVARGREQLQRDDTKRAGDTLRGALA